MFERRLIGRCSLERQVVRLMAHRRKGLLERWVVRDGLIGNREFVRNRAHWGKVLLETGIVRERAYLRDLWRHFRE